MDGFNPADSYGTVIVVVPDPESLYHAFATRLRDTYGKLPIVGTPRILRPRKKFGTISGFSLVDPGGNWLRIYKLGDSEQEDSSEKVEGLTQFILVAARLGDAQGNEEMALKTLENGLKRFPNAAAVDRVKAFLYQAELAIRINNLELAQSSLAFAQSLNLTEVEKAAVTDEFAYVASLVNQEH
jgi:hypothetical protein